MDDMNKYLSALGQSSEASSKVNSENAANVDMTSAFNAKLRNMHSEIMGATDPVGIAMVAKGASKVGTKLVDRVVAKGSQSINEQINTITQKGAARIANKTVEKGVHDKDTGLTDEESSQLDDLVSQSKLIGKFQSSTETAIQPNAPASTGETVDGIETGSKSVATTTGGENYGADSVTANAGGGGGGGGDAGGGGGGGDAAGGGDAGGGGGGGGGGGVGGGASDATVDTTVTATEASTEGTLASVTAGSTADDWNPIGIVTTIGLGLATLFAGIFGHKKEQVARHVQSLTLNPSTQFGV